VGRHGPPDLVKAAQPASSKHIPLWVGPNPRTKQAIWVGAGICQSDPQSKHTANQLLPTARTDPVDDVRPHSSLPCPGPRVDRRLGARTRSVAFPFSDSDRACDHAARRPSEAGGGLASDSMCGVPVGERACRARPSRAGPISPPLPVARSQLFSSPVRRRPQQHCAVASRPIPFPSVPAFVPA
jgi:hypothetical protein